MRSVNVGHIGAMKGLVLFSRVCSCVLGDGRQAQTSDMGEPNWGVALFSPPVGYLSKVVRAYYCDKRC